MIAIVTEEPETNSLHDVGVDVSCEGWECRAFCVRFPFLRIFFSSVGRIPNEVLE